MSWFGEKYKYHLNTSKMVYEWKYYLKPRETQMTLTTSVRYKNPKHGLLTFHMQFGLFSTNPHSRKSKLFCTLEYSLEPRSNSLFIVITLFLCQLVWTFWSQNQMSYENNGYQVVTFNVTIFKIAPFEINKSINL